MKIKLNTTNLYQALRRVSNAMNRDATRTTQNQIAIVRVDNAVDIVATDGHRMLRWREPIVEMDDPGGAQRVHVGVDYVKTAILVLKGKSGLCTLDTDAESCTTTEGTTFHTRCTNADFPPYDVLLAACEREPKCEHPCSVTMNGGYVADLEAAFAPEGFYMRFGDDLDAVWITSRSPTIPMVGVLMPVRK